MSNIPEQFYYKKNRLHQLRAFYYVVKFAGPAKAARFLGLGNSAITMTLKSLESDLDTKLFIRNRKNFQPTESGKLLYSMAAPIVQKVDGLYEQFFQLQKQTSEENITIAAHHIAISRILPQYLKKFDKIHPDVAIKLCNLAADEALERLLNEEVDFMFYPTSQVTDECYFKPLISYDPSLVMHKDHPLAKKTEKNISFEAIAKYDLIRIDKKLIALPMFDEAVKEFNISSRITFENCNWETLRQFAKAGLGLIIVTKASLEETDDDLHAIPLTKFFPKMSYGIMIKKGRYLNKTVKNFINVLDPDFFNEYSED